MSDVLESDFRKQHEGSEKVRQKGKKDITQCVNECVANEWALSLSFTFILGCRLVPSINTMALGSALQIPPKFLTYRNSERSKMVMVILSHLVLE